MPEAQRDGTSSSADKVPRMGSIACVRLIDRIKEILALLSRRIEVSESFEDKIGVLTSRKAVANAW